MTAEDLWQEYREECCPDESGETLFWHRLVFLAGVAATLSSLNDRPSCFKELCNSLNDWVATREAENN